MYKMISAILFLSILGSSSANEFTYKKVSKAFISIDLVEKNFSASHMRVYEFISNHKHVATVSISDVGFRYASHLEEFTSITSWDEVMANDLEKKITKLINDENCIISITQYESNKTNFKSQCY